MGRRSRYRIRRMPKSNLWKSMDALRDDLSLQDHDNGFESEEEGYGGEGINH